MQTPVEIDFQGMAATPALQSAIQRHVDELEDRYGRITACRVVVKGPGGHHRQGLHELNIRLALPDGREVNVARTPRQDERYTDLTFAINDTFRRARRRLQDHARRMQGQIKQRAEELIGTVSSLQPIDQFGLLTAADGHEVYFHRNSVLNDGFERLRVGTRVAYAEEAGEKGPKASTVKVLGKHGMKM